MTEERLTREQMRALMDAAAEESARHFGELLEAGAFDGLDPSTPDGAREIKRLAGWEQPTHEDVQRWAREGWLEAMLEE